MKQTWGAKYLQKVNKWSFILYHIWLWQYWILLEFLFYRYIQSPNILNVELMINLILSWNEVKLKIFSSIRRKYTQKSISPWNPIRCTHAAKKTRRYKQVDIVIYNTLMQYIITMYCTLYRPNRIRRISLPNICCTQNTGGKKWKEK